MAALPLAAATPAPADAFSARVLVAGSANLDFVTRVPHLPAPGETVLGPGFTTAPGGKGANQAVACARAGGQVAFLGALGDDSFAEPLLASLRESGVQDWTVRVPAPTGAAFISVAQTGENCITVASGANARLAPEHLPQLRGLSWLALQLEVPLAAVQAYARAARSAGVRVLLNAAPAASLPPALLADVDLLVVNAGELAALAGPGALDERLAALRARGPETVVVTLGAAGAQALDAGGLRHVPTFPVPALDTTGAGDTFVGVLLAALSEGAELEAALRRANVGAALACTRPGAQPSMPGRAEIDAALAAQGG